MEILPNRVSNDKISVLTTEKPQEVEDLLTPESKQKLIGTHSGVFHCDEVMACSLLKYSNEFSNGIIVRSRNDDIHKKMDIIVDVGSIFDPDTYRFDHHQRGFEEFFDKTNYPLVKLSSAGLIFKYFGREIVENVVRKWGLGAVSDEEWEKIYSDIYRKLFLEIDAIDNGVN